MVTHIFGMLAQLFSMIIKYLVVFMVLIFDSVIFGYPIMLINNMVLATNYNIPSLDYLETAAIIFLFKIIALLWKSVNISSEEDNYIEVKEKENE